LPAFRPQRFGHSMARAIACGGMPTSPVLGQSDLLSAWGGFTLDMLAAGSEKASGLANNLGNDTAQLPHDRQPSRLRSRLR
jgi:hypothetical protein